MNYFGSDTAVWTQVWQQTKTSKRTKNTWICWCTLIIWIIKASMRCMEVLYSHNLGTVCLFLTWGCRACLKQTATLACATGFPIRKQTNSYFRPVPEVLIHQYWWRFLHLDSILSAKFDKMEVEKAIIRSVLFRCRSRDIETLIKKWGWFSDENLRRLNLRATKSTIASQMFQLCQVRSWHWNWKWNLKLNRGGWHDNNTNLPIVP